MSAHDMQVYLWQLTAERLDAAEENFSADGLYMRELDDDLAAARDAFVGLAVTEIATLRGELAGPQLG
jgi:hypothetical protein